MGNEGPSPQQTANAQGAANRDTAIAQTFLNAQNQITPYGNLTYTQDGTWNTGSGSGSGGGDNDDNDGDGGSGSGSGSNSSIPRLTATTTLTPAQQGLLEQQQQFGSQVNQLGINQAERLSGHLDSPVDLSDPSIGNAIMDRYQPRFDEQRARELSSLETNLTNRGLRPGSTAWDRSMEQFNQSSGDSYNQLMIDARGRALTELLTERNQPINEISALMSGGQVTMPGFQATPQTQIANTDVAGIMQNGQAQRQAQQNAMAGGLFGLGSAGISGWALSDRKTKENIKQVGKLNDGTNVYSFKYKDKFGGGMMQLGVMADEVEKKHPEAVAEVAPDVDAVNYSTLAEVLATRKKAA